MAKHLAVILLVTFVTEVCRFGRQGRGDVWALWQHVMIQCANDVVVLEEAVEWPDRYCRHFGFSRGPLA